MIPAGGNSIQVTTAVMQYGYRIIDDLKAGLNLYLAEKGFKSVREVSGLGLDSLSDSTDVLNGKNCVGCHLCLLVCPQRAITPGKKRIARKR